MAALLKKRAVAEFSQVIQEEPPPVKKLRLSHSQKSSESSLHTINLQGTVTPQQIISQLIELEDNLPHQDNDSGNILLRELLDLYHREKEPIVRCKIATILGQLSPYPWINAETLFNDIVPLLRMEKSHKVISQLINALHVIGKASIINSSLHRQLVDIARKNLKDVSHMVRISCLAIIGDFGIPGQMEDENSVSIFELLSSYTNDQDSRVRSSAFLSILQLHQRGIHLDVNMYKNACNALSDDHEGVRVAAVKLVWVLSHLYPESKVPVSEEAEAEELRFVDDGFAKICNMMNDISMKVRREAASLLGSLHQVSPRFLEQTLDKKLMSNMRKKTSAHERAKDHYRSGEWSSGQKWADDKPKEEVEPENVSLMSIGACGAFVHGLEDEFLEVRNAALDSLCELAAQSLAFANLSQDSIIDMFNDEIESVRLNAINSLRKLCHNIELRQDQLEIILGVLQDYSRQTRESLREMLCEMSLATKECLNACIFALLDNLRRYPQDASSIWKCMKFLGKHHSNLALSLIPELLCLHPYFDTPEPDMDDPAYISILMLVFNAAVSAPTMLPMFQEYIWRHYTYLRDSHPDLVPVLHTPTEMTVSVGKSGPSKCNAASFLHTSVLQLENISSFEMSAAQILLQATLVDLQHIVQQDSNVSASAECLCTYLQCQLMIIQLFERSQNCLHSGMSVNMVKPVISKIFGLTTKLQVIFMGLGTPELAMVKQIELKALAFAAAFLTEPEHVEKLLNFVTEMKKFLQGSDIEPDKFTDSLITELNHLQNVQGSQAGAVKKAVRKSLTIIKPCMMPITNQVRKAKAVITEPKPNSDNPIKFTARLASAITVDAVIENVENITDLRVQVKYPDMRTELIVPGPGNMHKLGPLRHRVFSQVLLSHSLWSEACEVEISLVLLPSRLGAGHKTVSNERLVVDLCDPVQILLAPRPGKR